EMASAGLSGTLSSEIGNLSHLRTLLLQNNQLSGSIPTKIGKLSELQTLDLSSNQFVGEIPSSLGLLSQLSYLWLGKNNLSGQISNLTGVKKFSLNIKKTGKVVLPKNEKDEIETSGPTAMMRFGWQNFLFFWPFQNFYQFNVVCAICNTKQPIEKQQFRCDDCGICRVGGQENYFHCKKC
ncbi:hypothetical protein HN51_040416, partial [Arachis hypogaea]